ncbi:GDSL-type esterase/lipase family protein [Lysobacter terrae]
MAGSGYYFQKYVNDAQSWNNRKRACVLSIGDSWFQYPLKPFPDLQRRIQLDLHDKVLMLDNSKPGRDARNLVDEALSETTSWTAYMQSINRPFRAILVSLGGNDVIGRDFADHLKKSTDPADVKPWPWQPVPAVAQQHIKFTSLKQTFAQVRGAYEAVIGLRDAHAPGAQIFCHSYADVTPCNEKYEFFGFKSGPWMWKPMRDVGLNNKTDQRVLSRWLLASFAALLQDIAQNNPGVKLLDTRQELPDYDGWWDNEIHPSKRGFAYLSDTHWVPEIKQAI